MRIRPDTVATGSVAREAPTSDPGLTTERELGRTNAVVADGGKKCPASSRSSPESDVGVLVLAGGIGSRMGGVTPKSVVPIAGAPLLEHVVKPFVTAGCLSFYLLLGHRAGQVKAKVSQIAALRHAECQVESQPMGTGGAVLETLQRCTHPTVLVANGDTLLDGFDPRQLLQSHRRAGAAITLLGAAVEDATGFGLMRVSRDGSLAAFDEKSKSGAGLVYAGCAAIDPHRFPMLAGPVRPCSLEQDIMPRLADARVARVFAPSNLRFLDVGTPAQIRAAERFLQHDAVDAACRLDARDSCGDREPVRQGARDSSV